MGKRLLGGVVAVVLGLMAFGAAGASAAATPVAVAGGTNPGYLSVAVDGSGNSIVAWADKSSPGNDVVRWCVLPVGGGSCSGGGSLTPADGVAGHTYVYGTQVVVAGSTIALLADVEVASTKYESIQEWQSTDGGHTFHIVNGGEAVASGNTSADTQALTAVLLPEGTNLGFGFDAAAEEPTFHAFSLTAPTLCGRASPTTNCADGYAKLAPTTDADRVGNAPGNFASNTDGVIGVFRTNASTGNLGCPGASPFGMAYVFGDSVQSANNNYNASPGAPHTAWRKPVTLADCGVDYIAVGGGPSGFGVIEDNQITGQTQYHHYDGITNTFDTTPVVVSSSGEQQPSVSQDGAGGVYATYLSGGIGGPVSLSYSYDGGSTWTGPGTLAVDPLGTVAGLTSAVDPSGQGWAAWTSNGTVYAQPFTATDAKSSTGTTPPPASSGPAATTLTTKQTAGTQTGASITVPAGTIGETDQATIAGANAAHASGTVTYGLYASSNCSPSSQVAGGSKAVSGATAPASSPVTAALAPGRYYWTASYSGDSANGSSTSGCGSEVLTVPAVDTISSSATSDGKTLTVGVGCVKVPCQVGVAATAPAAAGKADAGRSRTAKSIVLGKGKFKIAKKGTNKLTLKLSGPGRRYFAGKSKVKVSLAVTQKLKGQSVVTKATVTVKVTHRKKRAPR